MLVPRMMVSSAYGSTNIESVTAVTSRPMSCADSWQITVSWVIHNPNNTLYSLTLTKELPIPQTIVLSNQTCASGNYVFDTGLYGDTTGSGNTTEYKFQVRLVQRSNSAVVQTMDSNSEIEQWTACPP